MFSELDLQRRSEIADARLEVAESFGGLIALLVALLVHAKWGGWIAALLAAVASYYLVTFEYRKRAATAEDEYHRVAGLGKYADRPNADAS